MAPAFTTNGTVPGFSSLSLYFSDEANSGGNTNQKWTDVNNARGQNLDAPVDLPSGLTAAGNYTLEVYWTTFVSSDTQYDSNFNNNFKATFDLTNPLPVALTAFTAQRQGADAVLRWTTASETDNAGYEVQASATGESADYRGLLTLPQASAATLTDALGREVLRQPVAARPAGTSQLLISTGGLRAGVYLARLALPTGPQVLRVVKQ